MRCNVLLLFSSVSPLWYFQSPSSMYNNLRDTHVGLHVYPLAQSKPQLQNRFFKKVAQISHNRIKTDRMRSVNFTIWSDVGTKRQARPAERYQITLTELADNSPQ